MSCSRASSTTTRPGAEVELERFLSADRMSGWQAAADLVGLPLGEFVVITLDRAAAAIRRAAEGPTPGRAEQPPARSSTPKRVVQSGLDRRRGRNRVRPLGPCGCLPKGNSWGLGRSRPKGPAGAQTRSHIGGDIHDGRLQGVRDPLWAQHRWDASSRPAREATLDYLSARGCSRDEIISYGSNAVAWRGAVYRAEAVQSPDGRAA